MGLECGLENQLSTTVGSDLYKYFEDMEKYLDAGPPSYVIMNNFQYFKDKNGITKTSDVLKNLTELLSQRGGLLVKPVLNWYLDYTSYMSTTDPTCISLRRAPTWSIASVKEFLTVDTQHYCCKNLSICGAQYYQNIAFINNRFPLSPDEETLTMNPTRLEFLSAPLQKQPDYIKSYDETYQIVQKVSEQYAEEAKKLPEYKGRPLPNMYAYSLFYMYFEQYTYIKGIALQNILISLAVLFGAVSFFFNFAIGLYIFALITGVLLTMITFIWLSNLMFGGIMIRINAISVVNLITAIGFAVEFCVHMLLKYKRSRGTKHVRVSIALNEMGSSIFVGIFLTKIIGISILGFAPSPIFTLYYFRMYMIMI